MRGKLGLVIGLGIGYVLGTRAGRERYEQIKTQALKVWNLDPVQQQVEKVKRAGRDAALAVPRAVWAKVSASTAGPAPRTRRPVDPEGEAELRERVDEAEGPAKNVPTGARRAPREAAPAQPRATRTRAEKVADLREKVDEAEGPATGARGSGD